MSPKCIYWTKALFWSILVKGFLPRINILRFLSYWLILYVFIAVGRQSPKIFLHLWLSLTAKELLFCNNSVSYSSLALQHYSIHISDQYFSSVLHSLQILKNHFSYYLWQIKGVKIIIINLTCFGDRPKVLTYCIILTSACDRSILLYHSGQDLKKKRINSFNTLASVCEGIKFLNIFYKALKCLVSVCERTKSWSILTSVCETTKLWNI